MALSTDQVLDAAGAILDADGLEGLSMRRVASALAVAPGALYHHVPDKQTLLAGVADRILAGVEEPLGRWREATQAWADSLRRTLLAHRDAADLVATARGFRLSRHDVTRHPATVLAAAGLPPAEARGAADALLYFVLGQVAEEQARQQWERFHPDAPGAPGSPVGAGATTSDPPEARFALGVCLILDGVEARLP